MKHQLKMIKNWPFCSNELVWSNSSIWVYSLTSFLKNCNSHTRSILLSHLNERRVAWCSQGFWMNPQWYTGARRYGEAWGILRSVLFLCLPFSLFPSLSPFLTLYCFTNRNKHINTDEHICILLISYIISKY